MSIVVGTSIWWGNKFPGKVSIGSQLSFGTMICKQGGGVVIYVSPYSTEVSRTWDLRNDAATTAQSVTGCTSWFIPNKGSFYSGLLACYHSCRGYWDCYSRACYWSSSSWFGTPGQSGCHVNFSIPNPGHGSRPATETHCVRAFRCVTY